MVICLGGQKKIEETYMKIDPTIHQEPAWSERGDFTLPIKLEMKKDTAWHRVEHLWCKKLADDRVGLCCIPFLGYNLALGDEIIVEREEDGFYEIVEVARWSGHYTFRTWFDTSDIDTLDILRNEIKNIGCLTEFLQPNLLAIDADSESQRREVTKLMEDYKLQGRLQYEKSDGHTNIDTKIHNEPVWQERADRLIYAKIEHKGDHEIREQLWAKFIDNERFEICCIPFFIFDLALGDEVSITLTNENHGLIDKVIRRSNHQTYWIWFNNLANDTICVEVQKKITAIGCLFEWYSNTLLAVNVVSASQANLLLDTVIDETKSGFLECVSSKSNA